MPFLTITTKLTEDRFAYEALQEASMTLEGDLTALNSMAYGIGKSISRAAGNMVFFEQEKQRQAVEPVPAIPSVTAEAE